MATTTTDFSGQDRTLQLNSGFIEFTIGSGFGHGTSRQFNGEVAEIIIYKLSLTDEQFGNVNNYLSSKYAL